MVITAAAKNITSLLGMAAREFFSEGSLRADTTNAGKVWIGGANVTTAANQMGFLSAAEAVNININVYLSTDQLYLVGTPGDKVYLLAIAR